MAQRTLGHPVIVVGASAGGVEALSGLIAALPSTLAASIVVVLHLPEDTTSMLPQILGRAGTLVASSAHDGERPLPGHVYVGPPGVHVVLRDGELVLHRGPRENGHRPAIDPLFRSAARDLGPDAIGVVLSGMRDDGTDGLFHIKHVGGIALVQDPAEALFEWMPRSALANVAVDKCGRVAELAATIVRLVEARAKGRTRGEQAKPAGRPGGAKAEAGMEQEKDTGESRGADAVRCPDCGGVMREQVEGDILRYRCRVGHLTTVETLYSQQAEGIEAALWAAVNALEERSALAHRMAARPTARPQDARRYLEQAAQLDKHAAVIRKLVLAPDEAAPVEEDPA